MNTWLRSVYAISAGDSYIKFGVSLSIAKRMDQMQIHCPLQLKLLYVSKPMAKRHAYLLEAILHRAASYYQVRGEWFQSCPKTLAIVEVLKKKPLIELADHFGKWAEEELRFCLKRSIGPSLRGMADHHEFSIYRGRA